MAKQPVTREAGLRALIIYYSKTGHTESAAKDIARGLTDEGAQVDIVPVAQFKPGTIRSYDVLVVGSPTYGNTRYRKAAPPVQKALDSLSPMALENRVAGAFTVHAGMGGEKVVTVMERQLAGLGAKVVTGGPVQKAGAPLSLWKGPDAKQPDVDEAVAFGRRLFGACPAEA